MIFGTNLSTINIGLTICGRPRWQEAEATRKDFNIVLTHQDKKFFTSELFEVTQDAIPLILHFTTMCQIRNKFFECNCHIGCSISLHSITNSGLIVGGQKFKHGKKDGILYSCESHNKEHRDPHELDSTKPRLASYKQKWKDTKTRCFGSIYSPLNEKD